MAGTIVSLHIAPQAHAPMNAISVAHLVPGRGIEGDRFYTCAPVPTGETYYEVSLVEQEAIDEIKTWQAENEFEAGGRRNIVIRACSLLTLARRTFRIGEVLLRGAAIHESACHAPIQAQRSVCGDLGQRWLGAHILTEGYIRAGDQVEEVEIPIDQDLPA